MITKALFVIGTAFVFCLAAFAAPMSQMSYLKATPIAVGDIFGWTVSISGDTLVVGAPYDNSGGSDSGAAYVFVHAGTNWIQQAYLKAANVGAGDQFGT